MEWYIYTLYACLRTIYLWYLPAYYLYINNITSTYTTLLTVNMEYDWCG